MNWISAHPFAVIISGWIGAAIISTMPPLPPGSGYFATWGYHVLQFLGANLDKMPGHNQMDQDSRREWTTTGQTGVVEHGLRELQMKVPIAGSELGK